LTENNPRRISPTRVTKFLLKGGEYNMSKDKQIPIEEVIKLIEKEDLMIDHLTNFEKSEATKEPENWYKNC